MEFLERLSELANCQYLSDLPRIKPGQDVLNKLQALDLGEYSLQELAEAACYIAGERRPVPPGKKRCRRSQKPGQKNREARVSTVRRGDFFLGPCRKCRGAIP